MSIRRRCSFPSEFRSPSRLLSCWLLSALALASGRVSAGDWPQILGPTRDGRAAGETLLESWPAAGPKERWSVELGSGYAGVAVVGKRVVAFHRVGDQERIEAIDAESGKSIWRADYPAGYAGGYNSDKGPRCVPTVHDGRIYVFGAAGALHSLELESGRKHWSVAAYKELNGDEGYFGAGSSPIVAGDKLLVNVGGRGGAGLVAFALATGDVVWKATDERASYSSPTSAVIDGETHVIFVTRYSAISVDPESGDERFRFAFGKRGPTVNAASPIVFNGQLFVTASYGVGAVLASIGKSGAQKVWSNDAALSSQYSTAVHHNGHLYGTHGREDIGVGELRCLNAASGEVKWTKPGFGVAHTIVVNDKLLMQTADGEIVLARAAPNAYKELARARAVRGATRALPALAGGQLYVRSNADDTGELKCFVVGKAAQ